MITYLLSLLFYYLDQFHYAQITLYTLLVVQSLYKNYIKSLRKVSFYFFDTRSATTSLSTILRAFLYWTINMACRIILEICEPSFKDSEIQFFEPQDSQVFWFPFLRDSPSFWSLLHPDFSISNRQKIRRLIIIIFKQTQGSYVAEKKIRELS